MPAAELFNEEVREIGGQRVKVTSYKIGERYFCHITNVDPDATIARARGDSRDEAETEALRRATARLQSA